MFNHIPLDMPCPVISGIGFPCVYTPTRQKPSQDTQLSMDLSSTQPGKQSVRPSRSAPGTTCWGRRAKEVHDLVEAKGCQPHPGSVSFDYLCCALGRLSLLPTGRGQRGQVSETEHRGCSSREEGGGPGENLGSFGFQGSKLEGRTRSPCKAKEPESPKCGSSEESEYEDCARRGEAERR